MTASKSSTPSTPPAPPDGRILVHQMEIPIRWGDMDAFGHVNNTVYLRYAETLRIDWLHGSGLRQDGDAHGTVLVNVNVNFRRQLVHPGTLLTRQYLVEIGRTSFVTFTEMARTDDPDTICADCTSKLVWINLETGRPVPIDETLRERMRQPLASVLPAH